MSGLEAGLNICIRLPPHINDLALANQLRSSGARCEALSHYQQLPNPARGLVIDITTSTIEHLDATITAIHTTTRQDSRRP